MGRVGIGSGLTGSIEEVREEWPGMWPYIAHTRGLITLMELGEILGHRAAMRRTNRT